MTAHNTTSVSNVSTDSAPIPEFEPHLEPDSHPTRRTDILWAVLIGTAVFLMGGALDWLLVREHETIRSTIELSDALSGLIAGGLGLKVLQSYRERQERLRKRLAVIADMNHHVRNALQVISLSTYSSSDREHLDAVRSSVGRIQWALKELLPKM